MSTTHAGPGLLGRRRERADLDALIAAVRAGESRALVVRGDAGVGKSALLEYVAERATGCRIVHAVGVESEMELAFAGLHQLCTPLLDRLERLPAPQRDALATAFGLRAGEAPDRFMVSLAVLSLVGCGCRGTAARLPGGRRAMARPRVGPGPRVRRTPVGRRVGRGRLRVPSADRRPRAEGTCRRSWSRVWGTTTHEPCCGRWSRGRWTIASATASSPRRPATRWRCSSCRAAGTPRSWRAASDYRGAGPLSARIEQSFARRVERMPEATQRLLLIAAAEPIGDPTLLVQAADRMGLDIDEALTGAEELITVDDRVRFRHPLVRSAVYGVASAADRRRAHAALAESITPADDGDRRAWHRAHAAAAPDEAVAAELEASAGRAQARGGLAAAAAFLERAVALTPDPGRRAQRALTAARAAYAAGAADAASVLLMAAQRGPLDEPEDARRQLLEAEVAFNSQRGRDAPALLVAAARRLEPLDAGLSRAAHLAGDLGGVRRHASRSHRSGRRLRGGPRRAATDRDSGSRGPHARRACHALRRRFRGRCADACSVLCRSSSPTVCSTWRGCGSPSSCGTPTPGSSSAHGRCRPPAMPARSRCSRSRSTRSRPGTCSPGTSRSPTR